MKHFFTFKFAIILSVAFVFAFEGCSKKNNITPTPQNNTPTLAITSLSVTSGGYTTSVIITGTGFSATQADDQVFFNGKAATITAATTTQLTVTVPLGAGTGNVTVSVKNGTPVSGPLFTYQLSAVVSTLAGSTATGSADGKGAAASFSIAWGIVADASGNLYVTDKNDFLVRKVTSDGTVSTLAGTAGTFGTADGKGTAATFSEPLGITLDQQGNLYVADFAKNLIRKITSDGTVSTVQVSSNQTGSSPVFFTPVGVAIDGANNLYVSGFWYVTKMSTSGIATLFAGGSQSGLTDGGPGIATLDHPGGMRFDQKGNLFIVDSDEIREIDANGNVTTIAGGNTYGNIDGKGTAARFNGPSDLAIYNGNIYVADSKVIRMITADGTVTTVAGSINNTSLVDGVGPGAGFSDLNGICVDSNGNFYVTDGNEIRKIVFE